MGHDDTEAKGSPQHRRLEDIRPEINRTILNKILLNAILHHLINWGHALTPVCPLGIGEHEFTFVGNRFITVSDVTVGAGGV